MSACIHSVTIFRHGKMSESVAPIQTNRWNVSSFQNVQARRHPDFVKESQYSAGPPYQRPQLYRELTARSFGSLVQTDIKSRLFHLQPIGKATPAQGTTIVANIRKPDRSNGKVNGPQIRRCARPAKTGWNSIDILRKPARRRTPAKVASHRLNGRTCNHK